MSKKKAFAPLLLALPLILALASPVSAATWQTVETWTDYVGQPSWQTVETWEDITNSVPTVGAPVLISPDNDSTIYDNTPTFNWIAGANASSQRFLLDDDATFSSPIVNVICGGAAMNYTVAASLSDDNYWWKVIAIGGGIENSSSVWTFELETLVGKEWQTVEIWVNFMSISVAMFGSGTVDDPYIITTVEQLQKMNDNKAAHYALGNDIDASDTINWNGGAGFLPIGIETNAFTGSFDGREFVITDFYINRYNLDYVGLFGYVGSTGVIKNVGMENENIYARDFTGGLVGYNWGTVSNSYSTGAVSIGSSCYVAGLVGSNYGTVSNSYSIATVTIGGGNYASGLVALNGGTISNSYSAGAVIGQHDAAGLVARSIGGTVSNSFWDNETSGQSSSAGGTGKTTENMKIVRTFTDVAWSDGLTFPWDFADDPYDDVATTDIWDIDEAINGGYPYLGIPLPKWTDVETWSNYLEIPLTGFISGEVTDIALNPVEDATITLLGTPLSTRTDDLGSYILDAPIDNYDVEASALGYESATVYGVEVLENQTTVVNFQLEPVLEPPPEEFVWVMFVIRFLSIFGPFGFIAWEFTKIKDPVTGARAAVWVGVGFVALVILWFVVDAIEAVLYAM